MIGSQPTVFHIFFVPSDIHANKFRRNPSTASVILFIYRHWDLMLHLISSSTHLVRADKLYMHINHNFSSVN